MKASRYLVAVLLLSLLPLYGIFNTHDLWHTHDGLVHLPRTAAFFKALQDLQIPVRWAGDLNYGYGMPLFIFIYHLPYIVASFFLALGVNLVFAFKLSIALSYVLSGVFMYLFARVFFHDDKKAFLVTVFYQFAVFRFIELILRGSFGEVYTYAFLPLLLYGITKLFEKRTFINALITAVAASLLILSHNSISLVFFATAVLFVICFAKNMKQALYAFVSLGFGLLLSSYYWLPALLEHKYTYGNLYMKEIYMDHFAPLLYFFIPNITNSPQFLLEGISLQLGLFHTFGIGAAFYAAFQWKKLKDQQKRLFIFCLLIIAGAFFFMQPISKPVWEQVAFLRQFQFPWRFLSVVTFATALLSVFISDIQLFKGKQVYYLLIALVVLASVVFWRPQLGYDRIDESYYWNFPLTTTYYGETDVIWSAGPAKEYPKRRVEVVEGKADITDFRKKSNLHTFTVDAKVDSVLVDHTQYFPGWRVTVDNEPVMIQFQNPRSRGELEFPVKKGTHSVRVSFGESKVRLFSDAMTVLGIGSIPIGWLFRRRLFDEK